MRVRDAIALGRLFIARGEFRQKRCALRRSPTADDVLGSGNQTQTGARQAPKPGAPVVDW